MTGISASLPNTGPPQPASAATAGLAILLAELTEALAKLPQGSTIPALVTQILPLPNPQNAANTPMPVLAQIETPNGPAQVKLPFPVPVGAKLEIAVAQSGPQPQWRLLAVDGRPAPQVALAAQATAPLPAATPPPVAAASAPDPAPARPPPVPGFPATIVKAADPALPAGTTVLVRIVSLTPPTPPTPASTTPPTATPPAPGPVANSEPAPIVQPETVPENEADPTPEPATLPSPAQPSEPEKTAVTVLQPASVPAPAPALISAASTPSAPAPVPQALASLPSTPTIAPTPVPGPIAAPIPVAAPPSLPPTPVIAPPPVSTPIAAPVPAAATVTPPNPPVPVPVPVPVAAAAPLPELPAQITGQVLPNTYAAQPLVQTPVGLLALPIDPQSLPPGTQVTLDIAGKPVLPAPGPAFTPALPPDDPPDLALPRRLAQMIDSLPANDDGKLTDAVRERIPAPGPRLAAQLLSVIASSQQQQPQQSLTRWLGDGLATALTHAVPQAMEALSRHWETASQPVRGPGEGEWRALIIPFMVGQHLTTIKLTTRRRQKGLDPAEREKGTRFLLDLDLSALGQMQFDGLVKRQHKRFDLIIRTTSPLSGEMRRDIDGLFVNGLMNFGLQGSVGFQADGRFTVTTPLTPGSNGIIFA